MTGFRVYAIRTRPDIDLPSIAVVEAFVTPEAVRADIQAVHRGLDMVVVMPLAELFEDLDDANAHACGVAAEQGCSYTLHWPPPLKPIKFEVGQNRDRIAAALQELADQVAAGRRREDRAGP